MGKGDRRTTKGKRDNSSYGNSRGRGLLKTTGEATVAVTKAPAKATKKVVAKKVAAK